MLCSRGGLIIQRYNGLRDLEAEMLKVVCNDVQTESVLQQINGAVLTPGASRAADAGLDIYARGFREWQSSAFFDVRVCYPNAESYRSLTTKQIYRQHESEEKRMYFCRVLEVEQGSFTLLVLTTTKGNGRWYHGITVDYLIFLSIKGNIATSWIRAKVSLALFRSALLRLA